MNARNPTVFQFHLLSCLASAAVNFLPPLVVAPLPLVVEAVDAFLVVFLGGMGSRDMRKESL